MPPATTQITGLGGSLERETAQALLVCPQNWLRLGIDQAALVVATVFSARANMTVIQRMLGHKSAAMTLDTYADLFDDDLTVVADKLDESVGKMWAPLIEMDGVTPRRLPLSAIFSL